jgi:hypothetical protein
MVNPSQLRQCGAESNKCCSLPEETAEDVGQEIVRDLKGSCKLKDNLTGVAKKSLRALGLYHYSLKRRRKHPIYDSPNGFFKGPRR